MLQVVVKFHSECLVCGQSASTVYIHPAITALIFLLNFYKKSFRVKNDWLEILVSFEKLIVALLMYCMMAGLK